MNNRGNYRPIADGNSRLWVQPGLPQYHNLFRTVEAGSFEPVEEHSTTDRSSLVVRAVPYSDVVPGTLAFINECSDDPSLQVEDPQPHWPGYTDRVRDPGRGIHGIGIRTVQ